MLEKLATNTALKDETEDSEVLKAFSDAIAKKALSSDGLTAMHVLSLLDSMIKLDMAKRGRESRHNFGLVEAVLCR